MDCNELSGEIVDAAYRVHSKLGPGLMEHVYQVCLKLELEKKGLDVKSEVFMPVLYDNQVIDIGYRLDLLVESDVIVELKAVKELHEAHKAQLLTYLKLTNKQLGLLINFNVPLIKQGIRRFVNGLQEETLCAFASSRLNPNER
ncbi:MAG: GxxExxY protein [Bdellovibrionales bacterium]|nr:GxxExxY protein [Bdellovibrionales bacterium]